ncbi:GntR family transcriptional regulator [Marinitoga hydrogenitolerans DSM 16785]|uniref:GntR family transcriptional regulator n=1 Tax=Marinitoga hydrogenitolerans (strain DSM 16785 / JCM 12826 / AT1271) TaxID=1122195 RepID=A0A1M4WH71_MARH1|nr:GntR family transcriptional regulator [Marinitoga hydrogenitolerans]SHE80535.1 GntR family transcriptional regulator [Marinitoga hydrogenitolerans DSM 16785]
MDSIDRNSPIPLYYQIKEQLKNYIELNKLPAHTLLPTEDELSKKYSVSRLTVRNAMKELINEGIIYRIQGKGTFVSEKKLITDLTSLKGFNDEMESIGKKTKAKVLFNGFILPDAKVVKIFKLKKNQKVLLLSRIRFEGNIPRAIENAYLNISAYPELIEIKEKDMSNLSLYKLLKDKFQIFPTHAKEEIEIIHANKKISKILNIKENDCVLSIIRLTSSQDNIPFEYVESKYKKDNFKLRITLEAK